MATNAQVMIDPLGVFMAGLFARRDARPVPLVATAFDVAIDAGLAVVTTTRRFRNIEAAPIEAILTFPMPVHAALFALEARIDGRTLHAAAHRRDAARETYEDAIVRGKGAVLHEEVLRGIHTLSIANLRPGGEVEVVTRWAAALCVVGEAGRLRIPLTVGDVYGSSGLCDADEIVHGSAVRQTAQLTVRHAGGTAVVDGVRLVDGRGEVPLDRPIDIVTSCWTPRTLVAPAADGRTVALTIRAEPAAEAPAALAVLLDRSGSMNGPLNARPGAPTNHAAAIAVAGRLGLALGEGDLLDLWEFSQAASKIGALRDFSPGAVESLLRRLSRPSGGTEIGSAIAQVAASSEARDILLVTDGKSHALDVQALAGLGRRVSVLLIGEDSLEANVGHLAALTGGELFVATETNLDAVAAAMAHTVRAPHRPAQRHRGSPELVSTSRAGAAIEARWHRDEVIAPSCELGRAVSAFAASLALPGLAEGAAAELAEAEGLVTHLTSLVLVDEAGEAQEGLPEMRKVALETPAAASRSHGRSGSMVAHMTQRRAVAAPPAMAGAAAGGAVAACAAPGDDAMRTRGGGDSVADLLRHLADRIDWAVAAPRLAQGDAGVLPLPLQDVLNRAARQVIAQAVALGIAPEVLALALAARVAGAKVRTADRVARVLLRNVAAEKLTAVAAALGL